MIITINTDTAPNEMHHIAVALQRIAAENGYVAPAQELTVGVDVTQAQAEADVAVRKDNLTTVINAAGETLGNVDLSKPDSVEQSDGGVSYGYTIKPSLVDNLPDVTIVPPVVEVPVPVTNDNLDLAGLPWDARIHAGSRERNTDGSWRVRRRPKGVEEAEWEATLARVTSELRDLMEIPVSPGAVADAAAETAEIGQVHHTAHRLTDAEVDQFVDIVQSVTAVEPPVVVAPPAIAPPVVIPPVTAVAPPIATASPAIETFAQVMTFLTARTPKDEAEKPAMVAKVNEILAANGLTVLTQLGQRPDLIPQVVEQFKAAFGE